MYHVSTRNHHDHSVPRGVLVSAAALLGFVLAATGAARLTGTGRDGTPAGTPVASRLLTFADRADGAIVVQDPAARKVVAIVEPGTNGFVRGTLRGLARERRQHAVGAEPPFRLTHWTDGRLSLDDTATGRRIDLEAFGPSNALAFARFFRSEEIHP